jgi:hypothetical protein
LLAAVHFPDLEKHKRFHRDYVERVEQYIKRAKTENGMWPSRCSYSSRIGGWTISPARTGTIPLCVNLEKGPPVGAVMFKRCGLTGTFSSGSGWILDGWGGEVDRFKF